MDFLNKVVKEKILFLAKDELEIHDNHPLLMNDQLVGIGSYFLIQHITVFVAGFFLIVKLNLKCKGNLESLIKNL